MVSVPASRPLRLLFNGLHSKSGGGLTYLKNILPLIARDPNIDLHLCVHHDQRHLLPYDLENVTVHYLNFLQGFWRLLVHEQIEVPILARRIGADVTFSPANYGPLMAPNSVVLLRNALGVASVERRPTKLSYWALVFVGTFLSLLVCRQAIAVSQYARDAVGGGPFGLFKGRLTVVPHGVSEIFSPPPPGTKRGDFLLAVSDIYVQKNLKNLIAAVARLRPDHRNISLKIVGEPVDAEYFAKLKQMVADEKLDGAVEFLGQVAPVDLADLYRRCRVFVFPSTVETFGNPLVEVMACGAAIASSNTAAMPEVVGNAAIFFNPTDIDEMAAAIDGLLADRYLRREVSRRAVQRAKRFSWERTAEQTLAVIKRAATAQ